MEELIINEEKKSLLLNIKDTFEAKEGSFWASMDGSDACLYADIDYNTVNKLHDIFHIDINYVKEAEGFYTVNNVYIDREFKVNLSFKLKLDSDILGLYKEAEEKTTLEDFFNDNLSNVVRKIKEGYPDVYNAIEDTVRDNLDFEDFDFSQYDISPENLSSQTVEDCAENWIEGNEEEAFDKAISNMSCYTLREKIKDAIDNL